jgi:hypothetical protein
MTNPALLEQCQALRDVWIETQIYGKDVIVYVRGENEVDRDLYNSIKSSDITTGITYNFKMFPFTTNPTTKEIEKAGIKEVVEALGYLPMKYLIDANMTVGDFDLIRTTVIADGITYTIKTLNTDSPFLNTYLYVVFGLSLK